ncbi:hypothetical protein Dimus_003859 [Dionaea muscipula]
MQAMVSMKESRFSSELNEPELIEWNGGGGMRKQERSRTVKSANGAKAVIQLRKN